MFQSIQKWTMDMQRRLFSKISKIIGWFGHLGQNNCGIFLIELPVHITFCHCVVASSWFINNQPLLEGGGRGQGRFFWGGISHLFLISNLKILPIWFSQISRRHLKDFYSKILKQGLLFGIRDFSIFKI